MPGPPPKRSEERIRRNKPDAPIDKVQATGPVSVPDLGLTDPHPMVVDLYESMKTSAQSTYYEPSDWQNARWTFMELDRYLKSPKQTAIWLSTLHAMVGDLLLTEAARRRMRIEVERTKAAEAVTDVADLYRQTLTNSGRG